MSTKLYDISNWCKQGIEVEDYPYVGEIDIDLNIGEIVKVGEEYFTIGIVSHVKKSAGVRHVDIDLEPEDKDYERNLICPYCGYEDTDSWELSDDDEEHECGRCGAIISYQRVVTVEYNSSPVKPPNVVTAKWI
jgi:DNA-directed RNA polymerase subunit RPC12/RpoP